MARLQLILGGVYKSSWSEDPVRVIAYDEEVVIYDYWRPDKGRWALGNLNVSISYYRTTTEIFVANHIYLRLEEYTQFERDTHRPELPFSFAQYQALEWHEAIPDNAVQVGALIASSRKNSDVITLNTMRIPEMYLIPFSATGREKPAIFLRALDGQAFTEEELIYRAWQIQAPYLPEKPITKGIGLHRAGLKKRVPSFYIWGARSKLGQPS